MSTNVWFHRIISDAMFATILWITGMQITKHPEFVSLVLLFSIGSRLTPSLSDLTKEQNPVILGMLTILPMFDPVSHAYSKLHNIPKEARETNGLIRTNFVLHRKEFALVGIYRLPTGESYTSLQEQQEALEAILDHSIELQQIPNSPNRVEVSLVANLPKQIPQNTALKKLRKSKKPVWCIGQSVRGNLHIPISRFPHGLICGATGGGKSNLVKVIVEGLLFQGIQVQIVDFKGGGDFRPFLSRTAPLITNLTSLYEWLKELSNILATRQHIAQSEDSPQFEPMVTVIDEFASISTAANSKLDKETAQHAKEILLLLNDLMQKGRSFGIHFIVATQRPDAEVLPGAIRAHIDLVVTFHVTSIVQSNVVLGPGHDEAYSLPPIAGRALVSLGGNLQQVQTYEWTPPLTP